jgi:hypothetical protein
MVNLIVKFFRQGCLKHVEPHFLDCEFGVTNEVTLTDTRGKSILKFYFSNSRTFTIFFLIGEFDLDPVADLGI